MQHNQTTYSPREMELTDELQNEPRGITPQVTRQRRKSPVSVRRNLLDSLNEAANTCTPVASSTPVVSD